MLKLRLGWLFIVILGTSVVPFNLARAGTVTTTVTATVPATGTNAGNLRLIGHAIPNALVTFLDSGSVVATMVSDSASVFDKTLSSLTPGVHTISIYASDGNGNATLTLSVDASVIGGVTVTLSGFLLPPTITVAKSTIKRPEATVVNGYATGGSAVTAFLSSESISKQVTSGSDGAWQAKISDILHIGNHTTYALVQDQDGSQSQLSQTRTFLVQLSADLNIDNKINLTDFSILMFSYGQSNPPNKAADINDNGGAPDLVDFSVMMFYWTGG